MGVPVWYSVPTDLMSQCEPQIADAFWEIIAADPDALDDFEQSVFHPGACIWIQYGCMNGEVYCDESDEP